MRMFHHGCMHLFPQVRRNTHCRDRTRRGKHHFVPILCSGSNLAFFPLGCTAVPGLELGTRLLFVDWITDEITPLSMWRLPRRRTEIAMNHSLVEGSDRWTILPVIWLESRRRFPSFRHELARQTVSVTGRNQSRAFLWSCALGVEPCSISLSSSGTNVVLRQQSWWLWRKVAVIWIFWRRHCCVQFCERWQWIVRNEQLISWGPGQFWSKCTSV